MADLVIKIKKFILICGDIAVLYLSLWLTLSLRYRQIVNTNTWQQHFWPFTAVFVIWLIIFFIYNLYDLNIARNNLTFYSTFFKALAWGFGIAVAFFYIAHFGIAPKTNLLIYIILLSIILSIWRQMFNKLARTSLLQNHVLIIGLNEQTLRLAEEINSKPQLGLHINAILSIGQGELFETTPTGVEIIHPPYDIKDIVTRKKTKIIITASDPRDDTDLTNMLYECLSYKVALTNLSSFLEQYTNKIPVNAIGQIWFLENLKEADKSFYEVIKRIFDLIGAILLGLVSLIFLPFIWLAVKIDSKGTFFFKQTRTGKNGKPFLAIKIRTMFMNSEKNGPQWAQKNDPRVTRLGRCLRKTRIDEIPQLWNVLRGELSFIGPRPERPEFVATLKEKIPFYNERHLVKPGLTGWAQINFPYGASESDALEKLQYDLYYIKNRSFILDISILLKTIKTVITGAGQ